MLQRLEARQRPAELHPLPEVVHGEVHATLGDTHLLGSQHHRCHLLRALYHARGGAVVCQHVLVADHHGLEAHLGHGPRGVVGRPCTALHARRVQWQPDQQRATVALSQQQQPPGRRCRRHSRQPAVEFPGAMHTRGAHRRRGHEADVHGSRRLATGQARQPAVNGGLVARDEQRRAGQHGALQPRHAGQVAAEGFGSQRQFSDAEPQPTLRLGQVDPADAEVGHLAPEGAVETVARERRAPHGGRIALAGQQVLHRLCDLAVLLAERQVHGGHQARHGLRPHAP